MGTKQQKRRKRRNLNPRNWQERGGGFSHPVLFAFVIRVSQLTIYCYHGLLAYKIKGLKCYEYIYIYIYGPHLSAVRKGGKRGDSVASFNGL